MHTNVNRCVARDIQLQSDPLELDLDARTQRTWRCGLHLLNLAQQGRDNHLLTVGSIGLDEGQQGGDVTRDGANRGTECMAVPKNTERNGNSVNHRIKYPPISADHQAEQLGPI